MKDFFIENEIWLLTRMGAFQRAGIYKPNATEEHKKYFSIKLKAYLDNLVKNNYSKEVSEEDHIMHIEMISNTSKSVDCVLKDGLNFGVSQKLLNLYLKYNWCLGKIPTPPHFPVDSIIQKALKLPIIPWTKMKGEKGKQQYISIIESAKQQLKENDCKNIAELELQLFSRNR